MPFSPPTHRRAPGPRASRPRRLAAVITGAVLAALAVPVALAAPAGAQSEVVCTETFDYSGGPQSYTVPTGVTSIVVDAFGAQGGSLGSGVGGLGGSVRATLTVTPGETLTVSVGQAGSYLWPPSSGTFGGGGASAGAAGLGGGASDVRRGGTALANRVVVAGGGGGVGGGEIRANGGNGGWPAGTKGANSPDGSGDSGGFGGTQTAGGAAGTAGTSWVGTAATAGSLGQGGTGGVGQGTYAENYGGGGGGGGYYGGGGGKGGSGYLSPVSYNDGGGGGGGSSFGPTGSQLATGVRSGHGQVIFTVVGPGCLAARPDHPSRDCTNGPVVTDGFSADGNVYTKLRTHDDGFTGERWVCFRVDGGTLHAGGKLIVADPTPGLPPAPDDNGTACGANTDPNTVPGPHPLVSGEAGPDEVHYEADAFFDGEEAWVCVVAGGVAKRVIVPVAETSGTKLELDPAAQYAFPDPWPIGPSRFCKDQGGAATVDHLNTDIGDDSGHVWLTTWQQSASRAHLCFRAHTPVGNRGAVITVDTTAGGGISPQVGSDASMAPCTVNVINNTNPVAFFVKVSPAGTNPASVCVKVTSTEVRAFVGATGAPVLPITCTEDPGTPEIC